MKKQASERQALEIFAEAYPPRVFAERPPQAAQRPARGSGRWRAASVSASKTPTAEADSEGLEPRRGERSERGGARACGSMREIRRARQSGSAHRDDAAAELLPSAIILARSDASCQAVLGSVVQSGEPNPPYPGWQTEGPLPITEGLCHRMIVASEGNPIVGALGSRASVLACARERGRLEFKRSHGLPIHPQSTTSRSSQWQ
jgi:hypothetical protein